VLAGWWARPDADRIVQWNTSKYREQVVLLWRENLRDSEKTIETLLSALALEQDQLSAEYERLFVGPTAIPCPPYEAVWRTDRPKHEQGTVMGNSTLQLKQLYSNLGLQLRPDQTELADHIAVELEALAYAWCIGDSEQANCLIGHLQDWLPAFCESVLANSRAEFYRNLAEITLIYSARAENRKTRPDTLCGDACREP
jgi:TorA maturation chaperone TorD